VPLRRFAVIGTALIGEDGVRDVATAVDIGSKSWPFDIRLRSWGFRPHIGSLPLSYIAGGDVRPVATNGLENVRSGRALSSIGGGKMELLVSGVRAACTYRVVA